MIEFAKQVDSDGCTHALSWMFDSKYPKEIPAWGRYHHEHPSTLQCIFHHHTALSCHQSRTNNKYLNYSGIVSCITVTLHTAKQFKCKHLLDVVPLQQPVRAITSPLTFKRAMPSSARHLPCWLLNRPCPLPAMQLPPPWKTNPWLCHSPWSQHPSLAPCLPALTPADERNMSHWNA